MKLPCALTGKPKNCYSSKKLAIRVARRHRKSTGEHIYHYRCRCGAFHIGHMPAKKLYGAYIPERVSA